VLTRTRNTIKSLLRNLGSLRRSQSEPAKTTSQIVAPWRADADRSYPSIGLTPARALALLQAADNGQPTQLFELFHEMLMRWPRLAAVEGTRRLGLTGLSYEITASENASQKDPDAAVAYCRETLTRIEHLPAILNHLATAIGHGIAVAELIWERGQLVDIVPVPHSRLITNHDQPFALRVKTDAAPADGILLADYPNKWIVHQPGAQPGGHFAAGLLRASVLLYLAQNLSFKDWLTYSQLAGMPMRVAQIEPGTPEADQKALLKMLSELGTEAAAVFSKNVDLRMIDTARTDKRPYQPLQEYCNTEITILWLGQHLTTDMRSNGSRAAAEVHDRVREDLLAHDMAQEAATLRRDLLRPLVQSRFGSAAPVPVFRRSIVQSVDTKVLAETLSTAINELGMQIPRRWMHAALGIPEPIANEPIHSVEEVA
jgi:phage gp29-like protein